LQTGAVRGPDPLRPKDTGLRNLPLKGYAQNRLWCEIVALASELIAWILKNQRFYQAS
jgi:hypothetical protein